MYCMKCGTKLPDEAKFCPNCGGAVNGAETAKPVEETPAPASKGAAGKKFKPELPKTAKLTREKKLPGMGKPKGKLPLKKMGIALGCVAAVVIAAVSISSAVQEKKLHTILAQIPDPETFFGISAEHEINEDWSHEIRFETDKITLEMAQAYVELINSSKYPFVLKYSDEDIYKSTGTVWWDFDLAYNGDGEMVNPHDYQITVEHYTSNTYDPFTEVTIFNHTHFELVASERYSAEGVVELSYAPDPEFFLGMAAEEKKDGSMRFTMDGKPGVMALEYIEILKNTYGMEEIDAYIDTDACQWRLQRGDDVNAAVRIDLDKRGDGDWEVWFSFGENVSLLQAETWSGDGAEEKPSSTPSSVPSTNPSPSPSASQKPKEPEVVSGTIQTENEIEVPKNAVPELAAWSNHTASSDKVITKSEKHVDYKVPTGLEVIEEYMEMLKANGFTLVDEYYFSYKKTFRSWAFTCDAMPDAETIKMQYEDTLCHVCIWMSEDHDEYRIDISPSLQFFDTGVRRGGGVTNEVIAGPSAGAGLYRMPDGSYQTTDGRLSTVVGNAMVIRDGKTYTCDARWVVEGEDERLWVENYYRNEGFFMEVPKNSLVDGDVLQIKNFLRERYYATEKEDLTSYNWHTPFFSIAYDGQWMGPVLNGTDFKALTVRLMYYQPGGEAVYYVYVELKDKEPSVVEALVAVDMSGGSGGNFGNATRLSVGDTFTLNYSGKVFGSNYHVYEWTVTDGAGNVRIEASGSTCRVQAMGKGIATVTVTYSYTEEEPDVLTGIIRDAQKSRSQSYNFIIE